MVQFVNENFNVEDIVNTNLFIACIGYEERSFYILDKIIENVKSDNLLIFTIDDYDTFDANIVERIKCINEKTRVEIIKYSDDLLFQKKVLERIQTDIAHDKKYRYDLDYSSMPRGWYGKIPEILEKNVPNAKGYYWYSEGEYTVQPQFWSTVGIDSYRVYSGRPSFRLDKARTHLIGIGYDSIRTQGLISILDPDNYVLLEAHNPEKNERKNIIDDLNSSIIERTSYFYSLDVTNIEFMVSKIKGLINEYSYAGNSEIILVPDGPKPLIFVMTMMPWIIKREGISCLHVLRNSFEVKKNNVIATGKIIGFSMTDEIL